MALTLPFSNKIEKVSWNKLFQVYREPIITYCITPNNSPVKNTDKSFPFKKGGKSQSKRFFDEGFEDMYEDSLSSEMILNTITGLFSKFYLPERVRLSKDGIKVKLNDVVSYKVVFQNSTMKFYLTIPERWSKNFTNAVRRDWGQVDITKVSEDIIDFNPNKSKAINIVLRNHHCLAIKHERDGRDNLYPSLSSLGSTMTKDDKMVLDFNIAPLATSWKDEAIREFNKARKGKLVMRKETSINSVVNIVLGFANTIMDEVVTFINDLMFIDDDEQDTKSVAKDELKFNYTLDKLHPNANGYEVQIKAVAESNDNKKTKHILRGVQNAFEPLAGDNQFVVRHIKTKRGIKSVIESIKESKPIIGYGKDIFCEKEMNQLIKVPNKQTLKEFKKVIDQDNFTRTEIHSDFFKVEVGALPFAKTLDKDSKLLLIPTYERDDWTDKGRKTHVKTKIDDRCTETLVFGKKGSGKTELSVRQALSTFLAGIPNISYEQWKKTTITNLTKQEWEDMMYNQWKTKSKSVFAFDVADGEILTKIWNHIPDWLRHRVIILNHAIPERPIPVNFAELEEFNRVTLKDPDYAYRLAEMEADLISEVIEVDKSMLVERWFKYALQAVHFASPDWGIPEAIKMLVDDDFRINEVQPLVSVDAELLLEMEAYNKLAANGENSKIVNPIQNRLSQIKQERKLWDCIAQKPLRDENGNSVINFRKWADGDQDGAYMVMVYIPKDASKKFRRFLFAHYFVKLWNVAISREKGFAGREYRPETLVIIDEIHQIIDVSVVSKIFIDLFKEVRKYSFRYWFTLHGWSSLAKAGRSIESDLKESIIEMGANLIMLKGGEDAFESLEQFMGEMSTQDYNNLMNMDFAGIFSILWDNGRHVFQGKLLNTVDKDKDKITGFKKYDKWDLYDLSNYISPYSRGRDSVRAENLERIRNMVTNSIINESFEAKMKDDVSWDDMTAS